MNADTGPNQRTESLSRTARSWRSWAVAGAVAVLLAGLVAVLATRDQGGGIRVASPLIGQLVPPLFGEVIWPPSDVASELDRSHGILVAVGTSTTTPDGDYNKVVRFDIDQTSRRWVLVNFFASWCVPCEREHPELVEWAQRHPFDGLVVGIPFGDRREDAISFYERLGGNWPVVDDSSAKWAVEFGVLRPPESFLVAPDGPVVARWQGQITADELDSVIAAITGDNTSDG